MIDILKLKFGKNAQESEDDAKLAESLQFLEEVLNEEDPEFMKSVGEINIDNLEVQEFDVKQSVGIKERLSNFYASLFSSALLQSPFWGMILRPFLVHKYPKQVLGFWTILCGLSFGIYKLSKSHLWSEPSPLFLTSYAGLGVKVHGYDMLTEVEPFYDNVRFSKNVMSLIKMTANIRPSENSSNNPMIAFEIILQGVSNEPIVEIKDREAEFRDLILRVTEEFTYDDLETAEGKHQLSEAILAKVNANLSDRQIRKVYYKNFVIKP